MELKDILSRCDHTLLAQGATWEEIRAILADSPTPVEVLGMLSDVGLPMEEFFSTYTEDKIADAIRYAKDLKDRYTVLWLNEQIQ